MCVLRIAIGNIVLKIWCKIFDINHGDNFWKDRSLIRFVRRVEKNWGGKNCLWGFLWNEAPKHLKHSESNPFRPNFEWLHWLWGVLKNCLWVAQYCFVYLKVAQDQGNTTHVELGPCDVSKRMAWQKSRRSFWNEAPKRLKYSEYSKIPQDPSFILNAKILRRLFWAQKGFPPWECFGLIIYKMP